jgi:hypothetical protein
MLDALPPTPSTEPTPMRRSLLATLLLATLAPAAFADPVPGFLETFAGTSVQGWGGFVGGTTTNPGTGGWEGAGDGYLRIARTEFLHNFGIRSRDDAAYSGNWLAAGIVELRLALNDVDDDQPFEIHVSIGNPANLWQFDPGFAPPENGWQEFTVDLRDSTAFTQIIGSDSWSAMLHEVNIVLVRHDLAPFVQDPDDLSGELGIDHIQLLDEKRTPVTLGTWGRIKNLYR